MPRGRGEHAVEAGIGRIGRDIVAHHDADADRAVFGRPVRDGVGDAGIVRIDRPDQPEFAGVSGADVERVARVVAVHAERRDQDRAVDTDIVHRRNHLVAGDLRRTDQRTHPRPARMVALVGVHLRVDGGHDSSPFRPSVGGRRGQRRRTISFLISAMAMAGFKFFGQVRVQFMIVWQR
jgi:hypothetical protein